MVNEARVDDSNSRSADRIERIVRGADGVFTITLRSGSSFFVPEAVFSRHSIAEGEEIDEEQLSSLEFDLAVNRATEKGVDLLSRREHSVYQLRTKLRQRRFENPVVEAACENLVGRGYLDDLRFAKEWIDYRIRKRRLSVRKLESGLVSAGLRRDVIQAAFEEALSDEYESEAFEEALSRLTSKPGTDPRVVSRRLTTMGFPVEKVRRYLEEL